MLIFWEQRLVFLATPKAGSSAVEAALEPLASVAMLRPASLKHMGAKDYMTHYAPYFEAQTGTPFTTVALMREPISWLRSWYRFRARDAFEDLDHPMQGRNFEAFAQDYIRSPRPPHADIGSQSAILCDAARAPLVDRIFRYEDIGAFVHFLEDRLDCAITLPRVNVPPAADVKLSAQTESALHEAMADDFALYRSLP